jgi:hypothetical protein
MKKIFVSYTTMSREINLESLAEIKKVLEKYGRPYIELLDKNSLKNQESIISELVNSDFLILLKTDEIGNSKWVQLELEYAFNHKIPVLELAPSLLLRNEQEPLIEKLISSIV